MENNPTIYLIRASHTNQFELQNYTPLLPDFNINVISSKNPLTPINLPITKLWSFTDLPNFPYKKQFFNHTVGGEQWLFNLSNFFKHFDYSNNRSVKKLIIHTAETYTPYTHQAVQLKKQGLISRLICTVWETIPHNNETISRLRRWKQEAYHAVDLFHTPTLKAKQALIKEGVNPTKIKLIPYGIDLQRFKPIKRKNISSSPTILTVARLVPEKGMHLINQLAHQFPKYDFHIVGSGNYTFTASNIRVEYIPYNKIHQVYQQADIFLFPSLSTKTWEEQYGFVLIEAMASGLPIITTNTGAIPEVVGTAGLTLAPSTFIKESGKYLPKIIHSPKLYQQLAQQAYQHALTHYNHQLSAKKLASLYSTKV